jgi:hypothetical protein
VNIPFNLIDFFFSYLRTTLKMTSGSDKRVSESIGNTSSMI